VDQDRALSSSQYRHCGELADLRILCIDKLVSVNPADNPIVTDGVIFLRPLTMAGAAAHLAGEDDEMAKWLNGGRSTLASVEGYIQRSQEAWRTGGPRRPFGVFDRASGRLVGSVEVNLARIVNPGEVNVSYGVFREWRGRGTAVRAINLMDEYLRSSTDVRQIVLRISPDNAASLRVADKAAFSFAGVFDEPEGRRARYVRDLKR